MIRRHPAPSAGATTGRGMRATDHTRRIGEASGKVAADCAALCCCCPCSVMNLVVLAVYKVPAGLCRQVSGKIRRGVTARRRREGVNGGEADNGQARPSEGDVDAEGSVVESLRKERKEGGGGGGEAGAAAEERLEREMWERFSRTGFWRSPSTKDS